MNFLSVSDKFKDQSNYLVAFLAAIIGLSAFKSSLESAHLNLLGNELSLVNIAGPIVVLLLISVYLSALALLVDNLNVTTVPLKGYLSFAANLTCSLALLAPVVVLIIWGLTILYSIVVPRVDTIGPFLSFFAGVVVSAMAGLISSKVALNNLRTQREKSAIKVVEVDQKKAFKIEAKHGQTLEYQFLRTYEKLTDYVKNYFEISGYGVKNVSLHHMIKVLYEKKLLDEDALKASRSLSAMRNEYSHGLKDLTPERVDKALTYIEEIGSKVFQLYLNVLSDNSNNKWGSKPGEKE